MSMKKDYLGDSVYVDLDETTNLITLTTENGIEASNTIHLEPAVLLALVGYAYRVGFINTTIVNPYAETTK